MAKKLSIGSWAYAFGPYEDNPIPFDTVVKTLSELEFDGIEIGAFKPHIDINDYPMKSDRDAVKGLISYYGLEVLDWQQTSGRIPVPLRMRGKRTIDTTSCSRRVSSSP